MWLWVDDPELGESAGDSDEGMLWKHTEAERPKSPIVKIQKSGVSGNDQIRIKACLMIERIFWNIRLFRRLSTG